MRGREIQGEELQEKDITEIRKLWVSMAVVESVSKNKQEGIGRLRGSIETGLQDSEAIVKSLQSTL